MLSHSKYICIKSSFYYFLVPIATLHIANGQPGFMENWGNIVGNPYHLVQSNTSGRSFPQKMDNIKGLNTSENSKYFLFCLMSKTIQYVCKEVNIINNFMILYSMYNKEDLFDVMRPKKVVFISFQ